MFTRWRSQTKDYPTQFWLMFWGMLMSTLGASMIWPFLMIYISERLQRPLGQVTILITINSFVGLLASFLVGPIADRLGRKWIMVISLLGNGITYLAMGQAQTLGHFAILMSIRGLFNPMYRIGGDAMLADLIPPQRRPDAYSLVRMSNNIGVAIGPAIGGFLAATSYEITFLIAAIGISGYGLMLAFLAHETLPQFTEKQAVRETTWQAYIRILRDVHFVHFVTLFILAQMSASLIWILMGVYAKSQYNVPENQFGLIATTNAVMVVFLQFAVTLRTKQHPPLRMMALGALFYALGVGSVSLAHGFWGFWISMVIYTVGEMILIPTASTYAANLAPPEMRGRYMSLYSLSRNIASGISSPLGGYLSDWLGPVSTWYGGMVVGLVGAGGLWLLSRREQTALSDQTSMCPSEDY